MHRYMAEFIGTFILVFAGTGAVVVNELSGGAVSHVGVSLTFGFAVLIVVYAIGHISGAHINPAVTMAFAVGRRFPLVHVLPYLAAQLLGAVSASFLIFLLFGDVANLGGTFPMNGNATQSFVMEFVLTFILMFVIMAVATDERVHSSVAGLAIGLTVAMDALLGGPISGGSMNPARSFGPALVGINFQYNWIYWLAPISGAIAAVFLFDYVRKGEAPKCVDTGVFGCIECEVKNRR